MGAPRDTMISNYSELSVAFYEHFSTIGPRRANEKTPTYNYRSISKVQLVDFHQCYVLIGWATTRLHGYRPLVAKNAGFEDQNNGG